MKRFIADLIVIALLGAGCILAPAFVRLPCALVLFSLLPGAMLLRAFRLAAPHEWAGNLILSLAVSLAVAPPALDLLWRFSSSSSLWIAAWCAALVVLSIAGRRGAPAGPSGAALPGGRYGWMIAGVMAWTAACVLITYWPFDFAGWLLCAGPHDYIKHAAVLDALHRDGLPLRNPFCAELREEVYTYYHYFYLAPATVRRITGGDSSHLYYGLYAAFTSVATLGLLARLARRLGASGGGTVFAVAAASLLGGFDLIPILCERVPAIVMDTWADLPFRVHNLYTNYTWCAQHVLGLVILLVGVELLSAGVRRWVVAALSPILLVAVLGSSVYLAMVVWAAVGVFAVMLMFRPPAGLARGRAFAAIAAVGVITLLLGAVQLQGYADMSARFGGGGLTTAWPRNAYAVLGQLVPPGVGANLLDLPTTFLLEYGIRFLACFLVGAAVWRRFWRDDGLRLLILASVLGVLAFSTWHSSVHKYDYTFKIGLFPSMALTALLCAFFWADGAVLRRWHDGGSPRRRVAISLVVRVAIAISLSVGLYEAPTFALRRFFEAMTRDVMVSRAFISRAESDAVRYIRERTPDNAIVQCYPGRSRLNLVQLFNRRIAIMQPDHPDVEVFMPEDAGNMDAVYRDILAAGAADSAADAAALLRSHHVDYVLVGAVERERFENVGVFRSEAHFEPVFVEGDVAVYRVRAADEAADAP